jgi:hypothetical protein
LSIPAYAALYSAEVEKAADIFWYPFGSVASTFVQKLKPAVSAGRLKYAT